VRLLQKCGFSGVRPELEAPSATDGLADGRTAIGPIG
jgi:hypothetical protein